MMLTMLLLLGANGAQATEPADTEQSIARLAALYDEVCLKAFPIDAAVDAAMVAHGAKALTPDEVKVTLVDDPGRGWVMDDGGHSIQIMLELPPFHACSVRRWITELPDAMPAYRAVADRFEADHRGFSRMAPFEREADALHIHAVGEQRVLPGGGAESLFVFDQHVTDPARRAKGETTVNLRFVHQLHTAP